VGSSYRGGNESDRKQFLFFCLDTNHERVGHDQRKI